MQTLLPFVILRILATSSSDSSVLNSLYSVSFGIEYKIFSASNQTYEFASSYVLACAGIFRIIEDKNKTSQLNHKLLLQQQCKKNFDWPEFNKSKICPKEKAPSSALKLTITRFG